MPFFRRALFVAGLVLGVSAWPALSDRGSHGVEGPVLSDSGIGSSAQTPPAETAAPRSILSIIDVKPDLMSDFGLLQAEVMAAQRAGGQPWRETWHTATFGLPYPRGGLEPG